MRRCACFYRPSAGHLGIRAGIRNHSVRGHVVRFYIRATCAYLHCAVVSDAQRPDSGASSGRLIGPAGFSLIWCDGVFVGGVRRPENGLITMDFPGRWHWVEIMRLTELHCLHLAKDWLQLCCWDNACFSVCRKLIVEIKYVQTNLHFVAFCLSR